jgi:thymidylate synthase ThyX
MNLLHHSKLSRALFHASYTFRKKLSHTADSQDQRHRMTPASRPILMAHYTGEPDYVTPELLRHSAPARELYDDTMARTWETIGKLCQLGVSDEHVAYLLPNAVAVRMTESADLLNLHHKLKSRLCYNAQEEIWRASLDEARQIRDVNPVIGRYLLPPCGLRIMTKTRPICPEGDRYCGVPVWKLSIDQYSRII